MMLRSVRLRRLLVGAYLLAPLVLALSLQAQSTAQIPAGPSVRVSDSWFHLDDCSIAVGRQAPSLPLADALRQGHRACPWCEPLDHQPEWAAFVTAHGDTIKAEVKAKAEAEAAEAKRKAEAEEAERKRRLAELEAERKKKETGPVVRLTEAQARDAAVKAAADSAGDPARFVTRFRERVHAISPDYAGPQTAFGSGTLRILVLGPLARFEAAAADRLQKRQPVAGAIWTQDVAVVVDPITAEAPDIKQVVVQRTDADRPAGAETMATVLASNLAPRRLPGAATTARPVVAGEVIFPLSAFEPGEGVIVRVIAVPASGANLSRTFQGFALRLIQ